jgi:3-phosphoshikimate 1-carboxyvinyltransferase
MKGLANVIKPKNPTAQKAMRPFVHPLRGQSIHLPGSKSLSNRALILAVLSDGLTELRGLNPGEDVQIMIAALRELGFSIEVDWKTQKATVQGLSGRIPNANATLQVGNAGTAARFLPALCALHQNGTYYFEGSVTMELRPIEPLLKVLKEQGCTVIYHKQKDHYPFTLKTNGLRGGTITMDGTSSSQFASALMMAAPFATKGFFLKTSSQTVSAPFLYMTASIMADFGIAPERMNEGWKIPHSKTYHALSYSIEADWTQASYFGALALIVSGPLELMGLRPNSHQGDRAFISILERFGLKCIYQQNGLHVEGKLQPPDDTQKFDFSKISDTFLTLAAIAPKLGCSIEINGIAHTRRQESNRPVAAFEALKSLGQKVSLDDNYCLRITPDMLSTGEVQTHGDHRLAMSFAVLGSANALPFGKPWLTLSNFHCVSKTFPDFFTILESLHEN